MLNQIMGNRKQIAKPVIGMGVTILHATDRHVGTIIEVSASGKTFKFQEDTATRLNPGMSDVQDYSYERDPGRPIQVAYLTRHGTWKVRKQGYGVLLGVRDFYYDFSF